MFEFLTKPLTVSRGHYLFLTLVIFVSLFEGLWDLYDWYRFDRVLNSCVEQHLYRCDFADGTKAFITYNGDHGPDE